MAVTNFSLPLGGTAQNILAADETRRYVRITPTTENVWINFGATAVVDTGILVPLNTPLVLNSNDAPDIRKSISIVSATTAAKTNVLSS
jgi:hypothetical protein